MILHAAITNGTDRRDIEVTVETFKQGRIELDKMTPQGWRRVHIRVTRQAAHDPPAPTE